MENEEIVHVYCGSLLVMEVTGRVWKRLVFSV